MKAVSLVLAHASQEDVNSSVSPRDARSPLHLASSLGNLAIAQLLIWVSLFYIKIELFNLSI
jgi:Arf-GAP/GTPase/ANK repeat/PH domain-containing protein 1/3